MPAYKDNKRGTWFAKFSAVDKITGKRKQFLKRGFKTKRDALAYEAQMKHFSTASTDMMFGDVAAAYLEYRGASESTQRIQNYELEKFCTFLGKKYSDLNKKILMDWYLDLSRQNLKKSYKNQILHLIKSIFKYGSEFYDLPDLARGLKSFKVEKTEMNIWTPDQFNTFIQHVEPVHYKNFFTFLYWTGCRKSEALNLRYDDIKDGKAHIRGTKTKAADRWIILPDVVATILARALDECDEEHPFLFGGEYPLNSDTLRHFYDKTVMLSGLPKIRLHDFRHSFASNAITAGCNIIAVSKYLGHSNVNITLSVYAHLIKESELDMVRRLNELA